MYARPPQHAQQHVGHPHAVYQQQQQSSPYVTATAVPAQYAQSHEIAMVPGQAAVPNSHPQLPQLHAYPHLQLQYTYPSPLQSTHQPPTPQTHHVYAQAQPHAQQAQLQQQQQQPQQTYRVFPTPQQQHAQVYAQPGHLQPHGQAFRPGASGVAGPPPRAPSPLSHQIQPAHIGQQVQYVQQQQQQQQHVSQPQQGVAPRPPATQARATPQRPSQPALPQQPQPQASSSQHAPARPPQHPAPAIPRQSSYNTRTRTASTRAASVTVNGALPSASTESSIPSLSRGPSPTAPSPGPPSVEVIEVEPTQTSRVNSQSVNGGTSPEHGAEDVTMAEGAATIAPVVEAVIVQPPPTFPYFGKEVVPAYLPGHEPIGIGLGYGLPDAYGGFGVGMGGGYFEDVKGGMDGWLDAEGHNADPLLQPGSAIDAFSFFRESLGGMAGGTLEEWSDFVDEHFDDGARMQIALTSALSGLKLFDLPSTSLPRFFSSFPPSLQSTSLNVRHQIENPLWSPPQTPSTEMPYNALPRHGVKVETDGEWRWTYACSAPTATRSPATPVSMSLHGTSTKEVVWKVRLEATYVPVLEEGVLKLENLDVIVEDWYTTSGKTYGLARSEGGAHSPSTAKTRSDIGEWGLPVRVMRILEILDGMEEMLGVVEVAQGMAPKVLSPKKEQTSPAKSPTSASVPTPADRSPVKYQSHSPLKVLTEVRALSPIKASPEKETESVGDVIVVDVGRDVDMEME